MFAPPQPTASHVWCDECLRWEHAAVPQEHRIRVLPSFLSRRLHAVSAFLSDVSEVFLDLGDIVQILDNAEKGLIIEAPPKETLQ